MINQIIPMARLHIDKEEIDAVSQVLKSGRLCEGEQTKAFEEEFAESVGGRYAVATSSGSTALWLAYNVIFAEEKGTIAVPSLSFFATVAQLKLSTKADYEYIDIDPGTYCLDFDQILDRYCHIRPSIITLLYGYPGILPEWMDNSKVIYDAAQAHFATFHGKGIGFYGDAVCYSFYASKNLTTGEGGMVVTNNKQYADKMRLLKRQGQESKYNHVVLGTNYRMTEMAAALGRQQLKKKNWIIKERTDIADFYLEQLKNVGLPKKPERGTHAWHCFVIRVAERDLFREKLLAKGVSSTVPYPDPLFNIAVLKNGEVNLEKFPHVTKFCKECLAIPIHQNLSPLEVIRVTAAVNEVAQEIPYEM